MPELRTPCILITAAATASLFLVIYLSFWAAFEVAAPPRSPTAAPTAAPTEGANFAFYVIAEGVPCTATPSTILSTQATYRTAVAETLGMDKEYITTTSSCYSSRRLLVSPNDLKLSFQCHTPSVGSTKRVGQLMNNDANQFSIKLSQKLGNLGISQDSSKLHLFVDSTSAATFATGSPTPAPTPAPTPIPTPAPTVAGWTEDTSVGSTKSWLSITSSDDGTKLAAVVYNGNIWTSTNSGGTWTEDTSVGSTKSWYSITSSADGTKLAAVVSGGNIWTF